MGDFGIPESKMIAERDVSNLNEKRRIRRLTEYRIICAALNCYIAHRAMDVELQLAARIHKKYKDRMDSTFRGAQVDANGRS